MRISLIQSDMICLPLGNRCCASYVERRLTKKALLGDPTGTCFMDFWILEFQVAERVISWQIRYLSGFGNFTAREKFICIYRYSGKKWIEMNFLGLVFQLQNMTANKNNKNVSGLLRSHYQIPHTFSRQKVIFWPQSKP